MNSRNLAIFLVAAFALNIVIAIYLLSGMIGGEAKGGLRSPDSLVEIRDLRQSVADLRVEVGELNEVVRGATLAESSPSNVGETSSLVPPSGLSVRISDIEAALARLQSAMDGISLEEASEGRDELFREEDGHLKADEYLEAGKFAIAGEGYLKFLENHPDHPDARNILHRARNAFNKAGYSDKALWVQEEILKHFPEHRSDDLWTLANMEKKSRRYADAAVHAAESAKLLTNDEKYWRLLYAAWYAQLAHGDEAGLAYYRDVQGQIVGAGYGDEKIGLRAQEKIDEIERKIANANRP